MRKEKNSSATCLASWARTPTFTSSTFLTKVWKWFSTWPDWIMIMCGPYASQMKAPIGSKHNIEDKTDLVVSYAKTPAPPPPPPAPATLCPCSIRSCGAPPPGSPPPPPCCSSSEVGIISCTGCSHQHVQNIQWSDNPYDICYTNPWIEPRVDLRASCTIEWVCKTIDITWFIIEVG